MWEKSSPDLLILFAELAPRTAGGTEEDVRLAQCFVNGNLFAGCTRNPCCSACLRRINHLPELDGAAEFEPMPGRKMKGYATLSNALTADRKELAKWMAWALAYAAELPCETKKGRKPSANTRGRRRSIWRGHLLQRNRDGPGHDGSPPRPSPRSNALQEQRRE